MKKSFDTLSEGMNALKEDGYTLDFDLKRDGIYCHTEDLKLQPHEFEIDEFYRFEGMTNPSDMSILYAISSSTNNVKGTLVDAYGAYADQLSPEMIKKFQQGV
ncbi:MAG TPA: hypothetical protein VJ949_00990 [Cryomorphaceae bacterium]|nr:hypothetical protein [Cryomorphaceae bacterium]